MTASHTYTAPPSSELHQASLFTASSVAQLRSVAPLRDSRCDSERGNFVSLYRFGMGDFN